MPHQCVRCNTFYADGSNELLKGCSCGSKLFFYVKDKKKIAQSTARLSEEDKKQIEKDVYDLVGGHNEDDQPVILDLESIKVQTPGKYEIDLVHLFRGEPLIYRIEDGKYIIDLPSSFQMRKTQNRKK